MIVKTQTANVNLVHVTSTQTIRSIAVSTHALLESIAVGMNLIQ